MNEIQRYLAEEHVEDFQDGLITRRELLRRLTLITGSAAAAAAFLAACGLGPSGQASPSPTPEPLTVHFIDVGQAAKDGGLADHAVDVVEDGALVALEQPIEATHVARLKGADQIGVRRGIVWQTRPP